MGSFNHHSFVLLVVMHSSNILLIFFSLNPTTYTRNIWKLLYLDLDIPICSLISSYGVSYYVHPNFTELVNYLDKRHKNIKFSFETKKDNPFSFLDVNICWEKDKFTTNVFRKDTFNGVYTNFSSFVALEHKFGLVYTLYIEVLQLCLIFSNSFWSWNT